jgi:hypothetical protein
MVVKEDLIFKIVLAKSSQKRKCRFKTFHHDPLLLDLHIWIKHKIMEITHAISDKINDRKMRL